MNYFFLNFKCGNIWLVICKRVQVPENILFTALGRVNNVLTKRTPNHLVGASLIDTSRLMSSSWLLQIQGNQHAHSDMTHINLDPHVVSVLLLYGPLSNSSCCLREVSKATTHWFMSFTKGPVIWSFDVFLAVRLNKLLNQQPQWFEMTWHLCGITVMWFIIGWLALSKQ